MLNDCVPQVPTWINRKSNLSDRLLCGRER